MKMFNIPNPSPRYAAGTFGALLLLAGGCQTVATSPLSIAASAARPPMVAADPTGEPVGVLYDTDFNTGAIAATFAGSGGATGSGAVQAKTGTIDTYRGEPTPALVLQADFAKAKAGARAGIVSPVITVAANAPTDLAKRTVGFDLWVGAADVRPVRVVVRSLDAGGKITGSRFATVTPPVAETFYRFCIDLDKTKPLSGKFDPAAPSVQFIWELSDADGSVSRTAGHSLRVDNVSFTAPAYYVSPKGSDASDGRTEKTAFATMQKAADVAKPGDAVFVMNGKYSRPVPDHLLLSISGTPSRWIVFRNYPGHRPEIVNTGWNGIKIVGASSYLEIRGITVRGIRPSLSLDDAKADGLIKEKNGKNYPGDPRFNTNGIAVQPAKADGDAMRPHHLRFIGNTVEDCPGGGLGSTNADYVTYENNRIARNCNLMRYGGSGMGTLESWDFDTNTGYKIFFVGNVSQNNRTYVPWAQIGKISDGNGIIIDCNNNSQKNGTKIPYNGRTLIQNNLVYGNGGTGIHTFRSNRVDIINNTAYHNAQSPELNWRQITANPWCDDVRIVNNIWWAQKDKPLNYETHPSCKNIVYQNNLVFGDGNNAVGVGGGLGDESGNGGDAAVVLKANIAGNPRFARPSLEANADFRLTKASPAVDRGTAKMPGVPVIDLDGRARPQGKSPDLGAFEGF